MNNIIVLADKKNKIRIGDNLKTGLIAEAGVLTFGEKETGFRFVDEAAKLGIKLLKFQSMVPENIVSAEDSYWLSRLRQRALSKSDFISIMDYGRDKGVICFASTHNEYDLVDLANAGMPILKIGSGDSNNIRMIDMALNTCKPVILSLGLLDENEIINILSRYKDKTDQLIVMHTTTLYPTPPKLANLSLIAKLKDKFPNFIFGYSDHTEGYNVAIGASAKKEVAIIEKHFCLPEHKIKPKYQSLDIAVALTPKEFKFLKEGVDENFEALSNYSQQKIIFKNKGWAHKAICARRDIDADNKIVPDDLMSIRPCIIAKGHIPISVFYDVVGKKLAKSVKKGEYIIKNSLKI